MCARSRPWQEMDTNAPLTPRPASATMTKNASPHFSKRRHHARPVPWHRSGVPGGTVTNLVRHRPHRPGEYIAQGWKVTDPQVLADVGPVPDHETLIEIPEDVLKMYVRRYRNQEEGS